jgi:hypothetical protein
MLKKKKTNNTSIKKIADAEFSRYIRLRDMIPGTTLFRCISCGLIKRINEADCGHYIDRQHTSTRFSETNCNAQCIDCNRYKKDIQAHRKGMVRKYGEQEVLKLEKLKSETLKITEAEYRILIADYRSRYKKILKERNLSLTCLTK